MSTSQEDEQALQRLLRAGRGDPGDDQLRRVEERFDNWLADAASPPSATHRTATLLRRHARVLPLLGATLVALGIGVFETRSDDGGAPSMREARRSSVASDRVTMVVESSRSARLPTEDPAMVAPSSSMKTGAVRVGTPAHGSATPMTPPPESVELAPAPTITPPTNEPSTKLATSESSDAEPSETEVSYLRRSRNALTSDPARALSIANGHPSIYPHGSLDQERELIAIDALVRLGQRDEARARADAFRARYPNSAHLGRVSALLGGSR